MAISASVVKSVENTLTEGYLAPNTFLNKRDIRQRIFDRYDEKNLFDFLFHTGRKKKTVATDFSWFEFGYLFSMAEIAAKTGTSGAGNTVTITATSTSHLESGTLSPGKKWDTVIVGGVRGWIQSVDKTTANTHKYVVKPVRETDNIVAAAVVGELVSFYSNAKPDGVGMPTSETRLPDRFTNNVQIFSEQFTTDGSISASQVEVSIDGKNYYYLQGAEDAANKFNNKIEFALLLNVPSVGLDDDVSGKPVNITRGMESYVDDYGNEEPYAATFGWTDFVNIEKVLAKERAPREMMMANGINLNIQVMELLKSKNDNTGIMYSAFGKGDAKQKAVDFGFNSFSFNRTYHIKEFEALNYEPVTGHSASPYPDMGFVIPLDRVKNPKPSGADDQYNDTICLRYKENDRENRFIKHWTRDQTITNLDQLEFNHQAEMGLQMVGLNQFVKVVKS